MFRRIALFTVVALAPLAGHPAEDAPGAASVSKSTKKKKAARSERSISMTGCIDQQGGSYILTEEKTLQPIAVLEAESFPQEGFAKHVGHKVTVRGSAAADGDRTIMRVRTVQKISEICAPQDKK